MLTRFIKIQLILFTVLTVIALVVLGWYYLRLPSLAGIGQYKLHADLPRSGGLYADGERHLPRHHDRQGHRRRADRERRRATMSIDDRYKIPIDASANVHSVSAIGEQYLDLVSTGNPGKYFQQRADDHQRHGAQRGRARRWTPPTAAWRCCPRRRSTRC